MIFVEIELTICDQKLFWHCVYVLTQSLTLVIMEDLQCIIHHKIKSISDINKEKIYAAKCIRESKGGAHHHEEQCVTIPNEIDPNEHGIHLEPCYKKFVLIISQEKERSLDSADIST